MKYLLLIAACFFTTALLDVPGYAHDVKDPVCRMMVDSDTTGFSHALGGKSFYFCSQRCRTSFIANPEKYVKLARQLEGAKAREYTVALATTPAEPLVGRPVELAFTIRHEDDQTLVREFEVIHERFLHLLMVSEDLAWFEHQHPVQGADGIFRLTWRFPHPGRYRLYADFTPANGDNQVMPLPLEIGGGSAPDVPLRPDTKRVKEIGDYRVELQIQGEPLRMERPAVLTYTIRDRRGRLIRDMQPFIGAAGHMIAISQDGREVVHTHALHPTSAAGMVHGAVHVTPAMATEKGPAFSFKLTLPTSGLYKVWAQFMHRNRVLTVPFTFAVQDIWNAPATTSTPAKTGTRGGAQQATIVIDGAYQPATVAVEAGRPVEITFIRKEAAGCGNEVQFPSLGLKRTLKTGEKTVVAFTPRKAGTISFTCGMSMYRGQVIVK